MSKYAVMLFETEINLGVSNIPNRWVNTNNLIFNNGSDALMCFADTPCPASQLIDGEDDFELQCKMGEIILNYQDEDWLEKNLYPYL